MFQAVVALLLVGVWISPGAAQGRPAAGEIRSSGPVTSEASRKIESRLRALMSEFQAEGFTRQNARARGAERRFSSARVRVDDAGRVQVYVTVADAGDAALDVLRRHDLDIEIVNAEFKTIQGWIPIDQLEALAAEPGVLRIRAPSYGRPRTGSVDTEGDQVHRCDAVRAQGVTGLGVTVGVISAGVSGLAGAIASGNLPADPNMALGRQDIPNDEGTAMLEIVHDCAPGATLRFSSFRGTSIGFIDAVGRLRSAGANVIVDDVGFYDEPFFEDGVVAQNDHLIGDSVLRVSAAGNDAAAHYQGIFSPGAFDSGIPRPGTRHDFGGGDTLLRFRVAGQSAAIVLQWADPFGAASDDYDWCVRSTSGAVVTCAAHVPGEPDPGEPRRAGNRRRLPRGGRPSGAVRRPGLPGGRWRGVPRGCWRKGLGRLRRIRVPEHVPAALPRRVLSGCHAWCDERVRVRLELAGRRPGGAYTFAVFAAPPGAFADGRLDPEDITALALESFAASSE